MTNASQGNRPAARPSAAMGEPLPLDANPHFDPVSVVEQKQRDRLARVEQGLEINTAATARVEKTLATVADDVASITTRLDHIGLNGHADAIMELAESLPPIKAMLADSLALRSMVERRNSRRIMWTELRSMLRWRLVSRFAWVILTAFAGAIAYALIISPKK